MRLELINIGDELLIGQTINTNASWIGQFLSEQGVRVSKSIVIQDEKMDIVTQLTECLNRADVVIITGGLGPTKDDITKITLCEYFEGNLVMHEPTLKLITDYFAARGRAMLETNVQQALIPDVCTVLTNLNGTAPGMWFERNGKIVVSLPGVPYEMKPLMTDEVLPRLKERFEFADIFQMSVMTTGIGESFLAEKISDWETKLRQEGLSLAYLPSPGIVRLRVTSYKGQSDRNRVYELVQELKTIIGDYYYGEEHDSLAQVVGKLLMAQKSTVGTVESCTSGALAAEISKIPGASAYFEGSITTYSNALKKRFVHVPEEVFSQHGAVSKECVEIMAAEGLKTLQVDYCIATSGIAGPDGGTIDKPVGTIWVAVAFNGGVFSKQFSFGGNRERNIQMTVLAGLNLLRLKLLNRIPA